MRRTCCLILAIASLATVAAPPPAAVAQVSAAPMSASAPVPTTQSMLESTPLYGGERRPSRAVSPAAAATRPTAAVPSSSIGVVIGRLALSLGVVLAIIGGLYWLLRRYYGGSVSSSSTRAVKVLSRTPLAPRQQVMLLQVGRRVVVVGDSGGAMTTLAQIDDPDEVAQLLGQIQTEQMQRAASFGSVFRRNQNTFEEPEPGDQPTMIADGEVPLDVDPSQGPAVPESDQLAQQRSEIAGLLEKVRSLKSQINR